MLKEFKMPPLHVGGHEIERIRAPYCQTCKTFDCESSDAFIAQINPVTGKIVTREKIGRWTCNTCKRPATAWATKIGEHKFRIGKSPYWIRGIVWHSGFCVDDGPQFVQHRLIVRLTIWTGNGNDRITFESFDYWPGCKWRLENVRPVLIEAAQFFTVQPGDTDDDYFAEFAREVFGYTAEQLEFAKSAVCADIAFELDKLTEKKS